MPGHKDPEGIIKADPKGLLYVEAIIKKEDVPIIKEPEKVEEEPVKPVVKRGRKKLFDLNDDGKVDSKDVREALRKW